MAFTLSCLLFTAGNFLSLWYRMCQYLSRRIPSSERWLTQIRYSNKSHRRTQLKLFLLQFQAKSLVKEQDSYSAAANVVEEVLSGIRTVFAFGGEKVEIDRYNRRLLRAKEAANTKGMLTGLGEGIMQFLFYASCALAFWYGIRLVLDDRDKVDKEYTPTVLMIVCCMNSDFFSKGKMWLFGTY